MKFPKGFETWNNEKQREWCAEAIRRNNLFGDALAKLSRLLVSNKFKPIDLERPDLEALKSIK